MRRLTRTVPSAIVRSPSPRAPTEPPDLDLAACSAKGGEDAAAATNHSPHGRKASREPRARPRSTRGTGPGHWPLRPHVLRLIPH